MAEQEKEELVSITIDGEKVRVPQGTNLIEAARSIGIEIPHYCYHPHLSIAGNCRMCQVKVKGAPKLEIACNTPVREGMEVSTQQTSEEVAQAQAAVLEFLLINHPLDCTVCDASGHCKLQDYHYKYNARPSRFVEDKVSKVKAVPLGPHVILDGERCIMCTRCIRFCDEITKTHELGMLNRGDRSVIAVNPGRVLDNALSGTVVDLCPVGALTHRRWRFNTRIWFTKESAAICPGCSTGCNCRVAVRDNSVVYVKARPNAAVNREWMCDEGRYGFERFLPPERLQQPLLKGAAATWKTALEISAGFFGGELLVFVAPDLLLEEYALLARALKLVPHPASVVLAYRERALSEVERILVSPDYAPNFRAAEFLGLVYGSLEEAYLNALNRVKKGEVKRVLFWGERSLADKDCSQELLSGIQQAELSLAVVSSRRNKLAQFCTAAFPGCSILEKSGLVLNRSLRLQHSSRVVEPVFGSQPEWRVLLGIAAAAGLDLGSFSSERDLTLNCLRSEPGLKGIELGAVKEGGVQLASSVAEGSSVPGALKSGEVR